MREVVTVHVGQCGLQIGADFWERVCDSVVIIGSDNISVIIMRIMQIE